ncbi:AfsR/SARP family transcriptional regulator [Streptomyces showdoensis]|uniref:AfsR/SARP family transcriptional regulator n=1 Tax=Streptomyces showdoensis TaxID=68268 RepID=UPI0013F4C757|nr:AfsR/SARP family transcriptional regulator [Streptomyces showdoensis]
MEFRSDGTRGAPGTPKERLALAALALDAGHPVTLDALVHRVWDDRPPSKPRASLHVYAARIRRRLHAAGDPARLVQGAHAYTLEIDPDLVDWHRFRRLTDEARALADGGDTAGALDRLTAADGLWRGEPLAGLSGLWAEATRSHVNEKRLAATLTRTAIELRLGRHAELVPDLTALLDEHPTDETIAAQLMTAAYGCGRQADALRTYDSVRRRLSEELGTDPGEALSRVHRLVLDRAPVTELLPHPAPSPAAPHTLPGHGDLVGRERELALLTDGLAGLPPDPGTAEPGGPGSGSSGGSAGAGGGGGGGGGVIALQTIAGMPGVGKSLLAVHAARLLSGRYPDGQVLLDLRTHAPGRQGLSAQAALFTLLRVFGVAADSIPADPDERTALWRTLLSSRRAVIVLDDAADAEQVRPLLPGSSPSLVIVTSRRRLTGLPGVRSLFLDILPAADAAALFRRLVGDDRVRDPEDVARIVRLCGHLPLAVELAAGRLASRPSWTTSHLVEKLMRTPGRLAEIRDGFREIARVFEMSYQDLTEERRKAFRLLSLHFGSTFGPHAAAAITGLSPGEAERALDSLLDDHLLSEPAPERFQFHDLVGEFARMLAAMEDSPGERDRAQGRLIHFYVHASRRAARLIHPRRFRYEPAAHPPPEAPEFALPEWRDAQAARDWLALERPGLVAAEYCARTHGRPLEAALLAGALAGFLEEDGHWSEAQRMHGPAARHWSAVGDARGEAAALIDLAGAQSRAGRYERALSSAHRALDLARTVGDPETEAEVRHLLGVVHWNLGRHATALTLQSATLELRRRTGDVWQIARCRNNMGITHLFLGNYEASEESLHSALKGFRSCGDEREAARVLNNLSDLYIHLGERNTARRAALESLSLLKRIGSDTERASAQVNLASTMIAENESEEMLALYREALSVFRRVGDLRNSAATLHSIGDALRAVGRRADAALHYKGAWTAARDIGAAHEETEARRALQALHSRG